MATGRGQIAPATGPRSLTWRSHLDRGMLLMREGKTAEAEAEYRSALAVYRKLADQSPDVDEFRGGQASTRNALGILLSNRGKPTEAEAPSAGASGGARLCHQRGTS
jgi:tetratricopeptide (TPR) repeat protein